MFLQLFTIARNTFVESVRQPVLFILVLVSGLLQIFSTWNTGFSMSQEEASQVAGDNKLLLDYGLATIFVIGTLLAGFIATAVLSREIENKTVLTIVSKPVSRAMLVLGKYLGVAGAIIGAVVVMLIFLLLALRHGVMSTASDELDGPVLLFGLGCVALSLGLAGWCNYFYGWSFPQTVMVLLVPLSIAAFFGVLFIDKEWHIQSPIKDLKAQVLVASFCLGLAVLVLVSVAIAASTRLGQVMTIVVCLGVFLAALLSNHLIGQYVFRNETLIGVVRRAIPADPERAAFNESGDIYTIELKQDASRPPLPRSPVYYSPSPSGFPLVAGSSYREFAGNLDSPNEVLGNSTPDSIVVLSADRKTMTIRNIGGRGVQTPRPPEEGDYLFAEPTHVRPVHLAVWGAVPNLQFFWLLDAVSQNRLVPARYFGLVCLYTICQTGVFLSLAIILFQRRDVG
jgi:ABC-2 type transport system permease protein